MEFLKVLLLGAIQGVTEWLPVSSTGHLILFDAMFPLAVSVECRNVMLVLTQLGSILAVLILFRHTLNPFSFQKSSSEKRECWLLWLKVAVASVPVALAGFLFDDAIESRLFTWQTVAFTLALYGFLYVLFERVRKGRDGNVHALEEIPFGKALCIGFFETLALVPGTSRSGSTILGGMLLGLDRNQASRFSFFLAIPAMCGASLIKLLKLGLVLTPYEWTLIAFGTAVSFAVSLFVINRLLRYLSRNDFQLFGWYRIILSFCVVAYFKFA